MKKEHHLMTKDELIAEQAMEIATLKKRVMDLELQEGYQLDKWKKVTDALGLSEFASIQTVTDRITSWKASAEQWYERAAFNMNVPRRREDWPE